jgi:hypothetical protein
MEVVLCGSLVLFEVTLNISLTCASVGTWECDDQSSKCWLILSRQIGIQKCLSLSKKSLSTGMKLRVETLLANLQRGLIILSIILFIYIFMSHLMTLSVYFISISLIPYSYGVEVIFLFGSLHNR